MANLGRVQTVPIRDAFPAEADFTRWLAQPDHLRELGSELGLELVLDGVETNVGRYKADIVGHDASSGEVVVIENQLEATDHSHLGQLLTYVSGLGATVGIWIADSFAKEHLAAVEALNARNIGELQIHSVVVELLRFDGVLYPRFVRADRALAGGPKRRGPSPKAGRATDIDDSRMPFWAAFKQYVAATGSDIQFLKQPTAEYVIHTEVANGFIASVVRKRPRQIAVELYFFGDKGAIQAGLIEPSLPLISAEVGFSLARYESKDGRIGARTDLDFEKAPLDDCHAWLLAHLAPMVRCIPGHVEALPTT